jgi:general stress protein 26
MTQHDLRESIENILIHSSTGIMATVKKNRPHARYMTFFNKNLTLYTPTSKDTDKSEEVSENPHTHILLGYEGEGLGDSYVEYEGEVTIKDDAELKNKLWNEHMKPWFDGPEDPNLIILQIKPTQIRLMNKKRNSPEILDF